MQAVCLLVGRQLLEALAYLAAVGVPADFVHTGNILVHHASPQARSAGKPRLSIQVRVALGECPQAFVFVSNGLVSASSTEPELERERASNRDAEPELLSAAARLCLLPVAVVVVGRRCIFSFWPCGWRRTRRRR